MAKTADRSVARDQYMTAMELAAEKIRAAIAAHNEKATALWDEVAEAVGNYNTMVGESWQDVDKAISEYNETLASANAWREKVESEAQQLYDSRSEKWQDGERGQAMAEFIEAYGSEFEELDVDAPEELEVEQPDDVDDPDMGAVDEIANLPGSPGEA